MFQRLSSAPFEQKEGTSDRPSSLVKRSNKLIAGRDSKRVLLCLVAYITNLYGNVSHVRLVLKPQSVGLFACQHRLVVGPFFLQLLDSHKIVTPTLLFSQTQPVCKDF